MGRDIHQGHKSKVIPTLSLDIYQCTIAMRLHLCTRGGLPLWSRQAELSRLAVARGACLIQKPLEEVALPHHLLKQALRRGIQVLLCC